ncbi:MAG: M56 family metallopeptidase [Verrucomicrobiota bacterium]
MSDFLESIFYSHLLIATRDATILFLIVSTVLLLLGRRIPAAWRHGFLLLVAIRLLIPSAPSSSLSWQNWLPSLSQFSTVPFAIQLKDFHAPTEKSVATVRDRLNGDSHFTEEPTSSLFNDSIRKAIAAVWFFGAVLIISVIGVQYWRFSKRIRYLEVSEPFAVNRVRALMSEIAKEEGVRRNPDIVITDAVSSPALTGLLLPKILIPSGVVSKFTDSEISTILRHETAHLQRFDVSTNWVLTILQAIHWFNPFLWWAFRRTRIEAERATDAKVLRRIGETQAPAYGETLIRLLEEQHPSKSTALPGVLSVLESRRSLRKRITLISSYRGEHGRLSGAIALVLFLAIATSGLTKEKNEGTSPSTEATAEMLKASIPRTDFQGKPLREALDWLQSQFPPNGPDLIINEQVDPSQEITLTLGSAPIAEVLRYTASLASAKYRIEGNIIHIEPASEKSVTQGSEQRTPKETPPPRGLRRPAIQLANGRWYPLTPELKEFGADYQIPELNFSNTPVASAISQLVEISRQIDPRGRGIEIQAAEGVLDEKRVTARMKRVSILDAAGYLANRNDAELEIRDGRIVIVPSEIPDDLIATRMWNAPPERFSGKEAEEVLYSAGVEFVEKGFAAMFDGSKNQLIVRHTKANLAKVEAWLNNIEAITPKAGNQ